VRDVQLAEEALALCRLMGDPYSLAEALFGCAFETAYSLKDLTRAKQLYDESLRIFTQLQELPHMARIYVRLGQIAHYYEADPDTAHHYYIQCLMLSRQIGDRLYITEALINLSGLALDKGDLEGV